MIDSSPQRYERFLATQRDLPSKKRLGVIRDVRTRWNSTYDMCERAVKLRQYIDEWLKDEITLRVPIHTENLSEADNNTDIDSRDLKRLRLSAQEWSHLETVTEMLSHFKTATMSLSQSRKPQIPYIWLMYNQLFDFLDQMEVDLGEDSENSNWPKVVQAAAAKGRAKLSKYYSKTDKERGFLFNCATILDPTQKLTAYEVLSRIFITDRY